MRRACVTVLLASLLSGLTACTPAPPPEAPPRTVYVTPVSAAPDSAAPLQATLRSRTELELGFRSGGRLLQRLVEPGDRVRAGQLLARLDAAEPRLAVQAARAQRDAAQVDALQQQRDAERLQRLRPDDSVAEADAERQRSAADAAAARLRAAEQQLALAIERLGHSELRAPMAAVVSAVRAEAGQVLAEGSPALRLADPAQLELQIDLPPAWVPGADRLRFRALERDWRLRTLEPAADPQSRTQRARFVPAQALPWRSDLLGRTLAVRLPQPAAQALSLPASALLVRDGAAQIWRLDGLQLRAQPVSLRGRDGDRVLLDVPGGLAPGTQVVALGAQLLQAGQTVRPLPLERQP